MPLHHKPQRRSYMTVRAGRFTRSYVLKTREYGSAVAIETVGPAEGIFADRSEERRVGKECRL